MITGGIISLAICAGSNPKFTELRLASESLGAERGGNL